MSNQAKASIQQQKYRTLIETDDHHFVVDEPIEVEGGDLGPNPGELLSAALAACTVITVKMYASRKGWDLQEVIADVDFERNAKENVTRFVKKVKFIGNLDEEQIKRLYDISAKCPIHRTLLNPIEIESELV